MKKLTKDFLHNFRIGDTGFLDKVVYEQGSLYLEGWAVCRNEEPFSVPQLIHVVYDDAIIGQISTIDMSRPDVVKVFPEFPDACGFSKNLDFDCEYFNPLLLELFALSEQGYVYQLHKDKKYTFYFQLEPTGVCNLRCAQCPNTIFSGFNNRDISPEDIDICRELIHKSSTICYDGFGEFFMSRNIHMAIEDTPLRTHVLIHSNGMLLDKHFDFILKNSPPIRQMIISLDSLREERYRVIREGGNLTHVLGNMRELKRLRDMAGQTMPYIVPNMKIMNLNFDELDNFIDLAAEFDGFLELVYLYDARKMSGHIEKNMKKKNGLLAYEKQQPRFGAKKIADGIRAAMVYARKKGVTRMERSLP